MRNLFPHHQEPSKETLSTLRSGAHTRYIAWMADNKAKYLKPKK